MSEIKELMKESFTIDFISAVLTGPKEKGGTEKVKVRPMKKGDSLVFQFEEFSGKQAFHKNLTAGEAAEYCENLMQGFKQMQMETASSHVHVLVSKKGKVTIKKK